MAQERKGENPHESIEPTILIGALGDIRKKAKNSFVLLTDDCGIG